MIPELREWHLGKLEGLKIATLNANHTLQQIQAFKTNLAKFDTSMLKLNHSTLQLSAPSNYQVLKKL